MLATSNLIATNAMIDGTMARILPPKVVAARAFQAARQTSQLQPISRMNCSQWVSSMPLPAPIAPSPVKFAVPLAKISVRSTSSQATNSEPARLPMVTRS